jgi:dUTP pyrophosphatase
MTSPDLRVRITRLRADVPLPEYQTAGAAGFDMAAAENVTIEPRQVKLVPTGLVIEVPPGMFLAVFARSSTPIKHGLMVSNGVGVVDSDYCGPADEVKIQVLNFTDRPVTVKTGDRIAQGIFLPTRRIVWQEGAVATPVSRGGFGSTD